MPTDPIWENQFSVSRETDEKGERLIPLSRLKPENKRKLWKALKEYDPARAALFQSDQVQNIIETFGGELCMKWQEIEEYLDADTKI